MISVIAMPRRAPARTTARTATVGYTSRANSIYGGTSAHNGTRMTTSGHGVHSAAPTLYTNYAPPVNTLRRDYAHVDLPPPISGHLEQAGFNAPVDPSPTPQVAAGSQPGFPQFNLSFDLPNLFHVLRNAQPITSPQAAPPSTTGMLVSSMEPLATVTHSAPFFDRNAADTSLDVAPSSSHTSHQMIVDSHSN